MIDEKLIKDLLIRGESSLGNFKPKEEPEYKEEPQVITSIKIKEERGKYKQDLMSQIKSNPGMFTILTPKGRMTVKDAIRKGYNPQTGEFDKPDIEQEKEKIMSELPENERAAVKRLTRPSQARLRPEEAEEIGLDAESGTNPLVKRPLPEQEEEAPAADEEQMNPEMIQALLGGGA